ncbi:MAG: hypothetical protein N2257_05595 [Thermodesulfovibrionales bacterium]|nr:hypothetical protein [Thermodesulfovibrionales bacterium]
MAKYNYDNLKNISRKVRADLASEGIIVKKRARRKPRDEEKKGLLLEMAIKRIEKYRPKKTDKGIVLPYYIIKK